jgi:hypothetical protein
VADVGDWVLGWSSVDGVGRGRLIYAMKISEIHPLETYGTDSRFDCKIPDPGGKPEVQCGDNIYTRDDDGTWHQRRSFHGPEEIEHDTGGRNALISEEFFYFGHNAPRVPKQYADLVAAGRGHRRRPIDSQFAEFLSWLRRNYSRGVLGRPLLTRPEDVGCGPC